ncbi:hypothetical protein LOY56_20785 [Pseudomonas sp. B21-048]|nr:hypothetical protein [Pseudomonas sp. B21-048]UVK97749.1 hypothetical protein LOY56_20785 [Pseudomonas sp. B21-048]
MKTSYPLVKSLFKSPVLGCCLVLTAGCATSQPNTFTFTADLPPDFTYQAIAVYVPAKGETCTVPGGRNTAVGYNMKWRGNYQPNAEIALRRTVSGCPLVISRIELEIYGTYGKARGDFGADIASVFIREEVEDQYKSVVNEAGESTFYGECQQLFRTSGKPRILRKLLNCKTINAQGERGRGQPFAAYTPDQLPGKTVKMHIKLADEERPGWGDTWVKVPNGWKRCMGKSFEDQDAYCNGNYTEFSTFTMVDGRVCTIYPGCTE